MTDGPSQPDAGNVVNLSKTRAKRLMNAQVVRDRTRMKELQDKTEREAVLAQQLQNACAVLEAVVRRHGPQVFDRQALEHDCSGGRIAWDITDTRITLKLKEDC